MELSNGTAESHARSGGVRRGGSLRRSAAVAVAALATLGATASAQAAPVIGTTACAAISLDTYCTAFANEGALNGPWTPETQGGAYQTAVAYDSTHGPLDAIVSGYGMVLAKEGSLSTSWTPEYVALLFVWG